MGQTQSLPVYVASPNQGFKDKVVEALRLKTQFGDLSISKVGTSQSLERKLNDNRDKSCSWVILDLDCLEGDENLHEEIKRLKSKFSNSYFILVAGSSSSSSRLRNYLEVGVDGFIGDINKTGGHLALLLKKNFDIVNEWQTSVSKNPDSIVYREIHPDRRANAIGGDLKMKRLLRDVYPATIFGGTSNRKACVLKRMKTHRTHRKLGGGESDVYNLFKIWQRLKIVPQVVGESITEDIFALELIGKTDFSEFGKNHLGNYISGIPDLEDELIHITSMTATMFYHAIIPFINLCQNTGVVSPREIITPHGLTDKLNHMKPQYHGREFPVTVMDTKYLRRKLQEALKSTLNFIGHNDDSVLYKNLMGSVKKIKEDDSLFGFYKICPVGIVHRDLAPTNILSSEQRKRAHSKRYIIDLDVGWGSLLHNISFLTFPEVIDRFDNPQHRSDVEISCLSTINTIFGDQHSGLSVVPIQTMEEDQMHKSLPYFAVNQILGRIGYLIRTDETFMLPKSPPFFDRLNREMKTLDLFVSDGLSEDVDPHTSRLLETVKSVIKQYNIQFGE